MSPRNGLIVFLVTGLAAVGFAFWMGQRDKSAETDRVARRVTTAGAGSDTTPSLTTQPVTFLPAGANGAAREIYERGNARAAENAKIRQNLAAGIPVPLPDSLKVADLPPEPLPAGPAQQEKK